MAVAERRHVPYRGRNLLLLLARKLRIGEDPISDELAPEEALSDPQLLRQGAQKLFGLLHLGIALLSSPGRFHGGRHGIFSLIQAGSRFSINAAIPSRASALRLAAR
jgi:hypothetical protein